MAGTLLVYLALTIIVAATTILEDLVSEYLGAGSVHALLFLLAHSRGPVARSGKHEIDLCVRTCLTRAIEVVKFPILVKATTFDWLKF